jgi:copper chaperone
MSLSLQEVTLTAPDIGCGHCVTTIQDAVGALEGVDRVRAEVPTKKVEIAFDPSRVTLEQIEATMDDVGYPASRN